MQEIKTDIKRSTTNLSLAISIAVMIIAPGGGWKWLTLGEEDWNWRIGA